MSRRFNTNPIHVDSLLQEIQRGELALPEFQRDFVWAPEATASLLVSVMQGFPAGSFLIWAPGKKEVAARAIAGAPRSYSENPRLVLDGQQRLTALYQAIYGGGQTRYYINLKELVEDSPELDEVIISRNVIDAKIEGLDLDRRQFREMLFPVERLRAGFQGYSTWCFERQQHPLTPIDSQSAEVGFKLITIGNDWIRPLVEYQFPVIERTRDASIDAVCHIFEKVNSTGQSLTMFELLTARFWVKGTNLRQLWDEAMRTKGGILKEFEIDPIEVLRVLTMLADLPDAGRPSAVFKLTGDQVKRHWANAVRGVAMALELLKKEFGVVDKQWLPYAPMLIPLAAIEGSRPANASAERGARLRMIHQWYWCSVFSGAYLQGAARRAVSDYAALKKWLSDPVRSPLPKRYAPSPAFAPSGCARSTGSSRPSTRRASASCCAGIPRI